MPFALPLIPPARQSMSKHQLGARIAALRKLHHAEIHRFWAGLQGGEAPPATQTANWAKDQRALFLLYTLSRARLNERLHGPLLGGDGIEAVERALQTAISEVCDRIEADAHTQVELPRSLASWGDPQLASVQVRGDRLLVSFAVSSDQMHGLGEDDLADEDGPHWFMKVREHTPTNMALASFHQATTYVIGEVDPQAGRWSAIECSPADLAGIEAHLDACELLIATGCLDCPQSTAAHTFMPNFPSKVGRELQELEQELLWLWRSSAASREEHAAVSAAVAPLEARAEHVRLSIRALEGEAQSLRRDINDARLRAQAAYFGVSEGCRLTNRHTGQTGTVALMTPRGSFRSALVLVPDGQDQPDSKSSLLIELRLGEWVHEHVHQPAPEDGEGAFRPAPSRG